MSIGTLRSPSVLATLIFMSLQAFTAFYLFEIFPEVKENTVGILLAGIILLPGIGFVFRFILRASGVEDKNMYVST